MENKNLLDEVYLPEIEKQNFYNSKPYQLLKDNGGDPTILENYETKEKTTSVTFDEWINEGGSKEDWIAKHAGPEVQRDFFSAMGDFVLDLGKDGIRSIAVGATNGVDFAVNLAPVLTKLYDMSPIGLPAGTLEKSGIQDDIVAKATAASEKLDEAREFLKNYKDDGNVVSKLVQVMGQDLMYSVPIYNKLKSVGMPTVPAFVISGGLGGAIGIEKKLKFTGDDTEQYNSTFTQDFFGKDISELKRLVGILPNTPYDEIADEVTQAFEYGAFSYAIPKVIDAFKFMKKNIPYFAAGGAMTVAPTDAEANPFKAITNAVTKSPVFKSAVKETVEQKITKGPGDQIYNTIKNTPGVKESELKWIGLESFLKDKKNVSQQEILDFIEANRIDVNERRFGAAERQGDEPKDLKDFTDDEFLKLENKIFEDIEAGRVRDEYRYVADHISYLRTANFQRLDNFGINKKEFYDDLPSEFTAQNYNMSNYMSDNYLWRAVDGLDDSFASPIGYDYWESTFADFYEVFAIKSKSTNQLVDDALELELYENFALKEMTLPDEMIRNADVNNGFHIQSDAFDKFKKYLDDNGAYIARYNKMEIPKDQRKAVFNETMIRSNEEMYYQNSGDMDSISQAMEEYVGAGLNRGKYEQYTAPGGEAYSEIVFTLSKGGENLGNTIPIETPVTKRETAFSLGLRSSPHFDVSGEIAHVRFKTRDQGNMRILSVEEMQSDLVQAVKQSNEREIDQMRTNYLSRRSMEQQQANVFENISEDEVQAYLKNNEPKDIIKDFPFKNNWYELVLKRLIRYAADNGYDAISIPKAKIIQDRYNLTRRINKLNITAYFPERQEIGIMGRDQDGITEFDDLYTFEKLKKEFGEDVQKKIIDLASKSELDDALTRAETDYKAIVDGDDEYPSLILDKAIEIGGQGKARLYNKTIPSFLKKYGKKWNAKVFDDEIKTSDGIISGKAEDRFMPVTIIEITPEMKQSVQTTSQPLFELFGGVSIGSLISESVSDNMKNNIISQNTN
jgi:hypothetical protein